MSLPLYLYTDKKQRQGHRHGIYIKLFYQGRATIYPEVDSMRIRDIVRILDAQVLRGAEKADQEVQSACCSDLMSDVLAFVNEKTVLLTGLTNQHVRTAEMLDLNA